MTGDIDAYDILGVKAGADAAALKAAHRRLVRQHHPDLVPADARAAATKRIQDINVAYGLVRDPMARATYDRLRAGQRGVARRRGVEVADLRLADEWEAAVVAAGIWAGRWWARNRSRLAGGAKRGVKTARRAGMEAAGRVVWLVMMAIGVALGWVGAVTLTRATQLGGGLTAAVGALGGGLIGSQRGWYRRLRMVNAPLPRSARLWRVGGLAAWATAVGLTLLVDVRF